MNKLEQKRKSRRVRDSWQDGIYHGIMSYHKLFEQFLVILISELESIEKLTDERN